MKIVIHQPYFLPWLGYFSKLAFADAFIVLDDVQFRKRHFFDRTRIINMHGVEQWLGLPVGENFRAKCREVILRDGKCRDRIISTLQHSYRRARFFDEAMPLLGEALSGSIQQGADLVTINLDIILGLLRHLDLKCPDVHYSSRCAPAMGATARVRALCKALGARELIIGAGSSRRVHDWTSITEGGVGVFVQDYLSSHPHYTQTRRHRVPFTAGLSIADALMYVGVDSCRDFVAGTRFTPTPWRP